MLTKLKNIYSAIAIVFTVLFIFFQGCKKSSGSDSTPKTGYYFSADINGKGWNANFVSPTDLSPGINTGAVYSTEASPGSSTYYAYGTNPAYGGSGTFTVTEFDQTNKIAAGTFSGTFGSTTGTTVNITDGKFRCALVSSTSAFPPNVKY